MDAFLDITQNVAAWSGILLWAVLVGLSGLTILISLPGGWVALGLCVLWDLGHGFEAIGWWRLIVFTGLLVLGEILEAMLGTLYVAKKGATKWGVAGTFFGGIAGAVFGSGLMPIVGTLIGAFGGAFAGAVAGELVAEQKLEPSLRVGVHATLGRLLAVFAKSTLAAYGIGLALVAAFAARLAGGGPA